jgi:predicted restriction endonuclease
MKIWRAKNPDYYRVEMQLQVCPRCGKIVSRDSKSEYCKDCRKIVRREKHSAFCLARYHKHRRAVIAAYGGKCACCGETEYDFLEVDHIANDGAADRAKHGAGRKGKAGSNWYAWVVKNDFPSGLQILCANCHLAKTKGIICPHKR